MSKLSFKELKERFKQKEQEKAALANGEGKKKYKNNDIYPFWSMEVGQSCTVRILPDLNTETSEAFPISIDYKRHTLSVSGKDVTFPCLTNYGEQCPVCEVSRKWYKEGTTTKGKYFYRKLNKLLRGVVISDPLPADEETGENAEGLTKTLQFTPELMGQLLLHIAEDDLGDDEPWDLAKGYNFKISKVKGGARQDGKGFYDDYIGAFVRLPTDISELEPVLIDLTTLLPANPGLEKVQRLLDAHQSGTDLEDGDDEEHNNSTPAEKTTKVEETPKNVEADKIAEDIDHEEDALMRKIRERREAAASK